MFYGHKNTKINLDQYYTPFTIGKLMCNLCHDLKNIIDPACGTGDLILNYNGFLSGPQSRTDLFFLNNFYFCW